jgi:hypothetical protein
MTADEKRRMLSTSEAAPLEIPRSVLSAHLVHTREIPNGRDFLFAGPAEQIRDALRKLVEIEHRQEPLLHFDYAQVEDYFLLRIIGSSQYAERIRDYFTEQR